MRAPLLATALLVLLVPAAPAQEAGHFVPEWREGPATVTFQNRTLEVASGEWYATDGGTWFYAVRGEGPGPEDYQGCRGAAGEGATVVAVGDDACARHPGVSCSGTRLCEDALGVTGPAGSPPPTPPYVVDRGEWDEFVPAWRGGPANVTFQDRTIEVREGEYLATDGETYVYGVAGQAPGRDGYGGCSEDLPTGTWVSFPTSCARHPSFACGGGPRDFCERVFGHGMPGGPPPMVQYVDHGEWTEAVPVWRATPAEVRFDGGLHHAPVGGFAATGANYTYVVEATSPPEREACPVDFGSGTWALVSSSPCRWALHPAEECVGSALYCGATTGRRVAAATQQPTPTAVDTCADVPFARCTPVPAGAWLALGLVISSLAFRKAQRRS